MDYHHSFLGDKDDLVGASIYENPNNIKKIPEYDDVIYKAFAYNESYLCINKQGSYNAKIDENLKEYPKSKMWAGEINYILNTTGYFTNNRWSNIKGNIQITNYRLIFLPDDFIFLGKTSIRKDYFHFPMTFIEEITYQTKKEIDLPVEIKFLMKDARTFSLKVQSKPEIDYLKTFDYLISRSKIENFRSFFAFYYREECKKAHKGSDFFWELYDIKAEIKRQGIQDKIVSGFQEKQNCLWRLIDNIDYSICSTYPSYFMIPAKISKCQMMKSAEFRMKNRLPVLVYAIKKQDTANKNFKYVTLWRSSQIMMGIRLSRCTEDENLIKLIGDPYLDIDKIEKESDNVNNSVNLHIFDARCYSSAIGNQFIGGGTENNNNYKNCEVFFKNIENIHVVRESYRKLCDLCNNNYDNAKWFSLLEETRWLEIVSCILTAVKEIIESFSKGISVLVHCSDGWDRTTQMVSLVQIMIDPYFRTIKGFQNLIDKDWIAFGHKFRLRNGVGSNMDDKSQNAPVFLQFLDCVHQILKQYPSAFEFNLKYLSDIAKHSYTTIFGNFLCNCEKELNDEITKKTNSLWNYLDPKVYKNAFYEKYEGDYLIPDTSISSMKLWEEWFMYHTKILKKSCCKKASEFYEDYYHCFYMNKKNSNFENSEKDFEIIDRKDNI